MKKRNSNIIVAIDGPAGSGKSTVSKKIAKSLGLLYLDTGAMYRALTLKAMRGNLCLDDEAALTILAKETEIGFSAGSGSTVLLDGVDVSLAIRTPDVTNNIKHIARVAGVRHEMVLAQRLIGKKGGAVLEGRDIGTVVFPDADYKFYLDADLEERARRRYKELVDSGQKVDLEEMKRDVSVRDKSDMARSVGPLIKASDAIVVDTTDLSIDQVVEKLISYIK